MQVRALHRWDLSPAQAIAVQQGLRERVRTCDEICQVRSVAGVDISTAGRSAHAAVVALGFPDLRPVEAAQADLPLTFPYIPGLLAFRELPGILAAIERLHMQPDLFLVDGQGLAHPRRMGIASHLGVIINVPTIGCAKSLLCGQHGEVGPDVGEHSDILHQGEVIGVALRTRVDTNPVYVSVGHRISLATAITYVLRCGSGYRVPEPIRWAHLLAGGAKLPQAQSEQGRLF